MIDYSRLSRNWMKWSGLMGMGDVRTVAGSDASRVDFTASDWGFYISQSGDWWIVGEVDDRGQSHDDTARFSSFSLTETYLIWTWASVARSAIGAKRLGADLYARGFSPTTQVTELKAGVYELKSPDGADAIVKGVKATIFSHLMTKPVDDVEAMVNEGIE